MVVPLRLAVVRERVRRTEGRLLVLLLLVVVASAVVGAVAATAAGHRGALAGESTDSAASSVRGAQEVRRALSDADATAFNAVLVDAAQAPRLRDRFRQDLAITTNWLSGARSDADWVALVSDQLPVYAGLVETGWAYTRQGQPLGAAYLREASHLLRSKVLTAVDTAHAQGVDELAETQDAAGSAPWGAMVLSVVLLAGLVVAQVWLARRTRRRFNVGLLLASVAVLVGVLWLGVAAWRSGAASARADRDGLAQTEWLAKARDHGLRADAHEAMVLVFRDEVDAQRVELSRSLDEVDSLLYRMLNREPMRVDSEDTRVLLAKATAIAGQWRTAALGDGRTRPTDATVTARGYVDAVYQATDEKGLQFDRVMADATRQAMDRFDAAAIDARDAWAGAALVQWLVALAAVGGAVVGLAPRIAEYR